MGNGDRELMDWQAFFSMGGYAAYVWPSYGLALAVLIGQALWSRLRHSAVVRNARSEQDDDAGSP
ncbi:MAG: heme exporter protein CcmD [Nevskiales bacterium]